MSNDKYLLLYKQLVVDLGFDKCAGQLVSYETVLSSADLWKAQAFPPALIPLYSSYSGTVGYWKHWNSERTTCIVKLSGDAAFGERSIVYELATSFIQLKYIYFLDLLSGMCQRL